MSGTSAGACLPSANNRSDTARRSRTASAMSPTSPQLESLGPFAVGETVVDAPGDLDGLEQEPVELGVRGRGGHWRSASISSSQPSSDWPPPSS